MKVKEIAKKIADLLYSKEYNKGVIYFDFKSYDDAKDIPSLIIDGELIPIEEFRISENGNKIVVLDDDCNVYRRIGRKYRRRYKGYQNFTVYKNRTARNKTCRKA